MEMKNTTVYGLGVTGRGQYVGVGLDCFFGSTDLIGHGLGQTVELDSTIVGLECNVEITPMPTRLTPVLSGGVGLISFSNDDEDVEESDFSYNLAGGLRWDITDFFFASAMYKVTWTTLEETDDPMKLSGFRLALGFGAHPSVRR